ncbi:MAG: DNA-processing protein DprA [Microgenomates group bacterium]
MNVLGKILPKDSYSIAIVGSRMATPRGKELAFNFSYVLAKKGVTIISGLARGIDTAAHKGAISAGGRTIAVMGSGIDVIYPPENKVLVSEIVKNGALVSEFPNGTKPLPGNFLQRNRLIAKLSKAVLVIEGMRRSGTLSTASWAGDLAKEVFAIPGSEATDWLINNGATVAMDPQSILDYLNAVNNS